MGYDIVLGVQWLRELGPITWDFSNLTTKFSKKNQNITLQGMKEGTVHLASKRQVGKMISSFKGGCRLLLTHVNSHSTTDQQDPLQKWPKELQDLPWQF